MAKVFLLVPGDNERAFFFAGQYPASASLPLPSQIGLGGVDWLEKVVGWFKANKTIFTGDFWETVKGKFKGFLTWVREQSAVVLVADCGTFYRVRETDTGVAYVEVSKPGPSDKVIKAALVPGWISPCGAEAPKTSAPVQSDVNQLLRKYWPYGLLVVALLISRSGGEAPATGR